MTCNHPRAMSRKTMKIKVPYEGPTRRSDRRELNSYSGTMTKVASFLSKREKKKAVYSFQISLFLQEIFKFFKCENLPIDDVIHSTKILIKHYGKDIAGNLYQNCLIHCSKFY